MNLSYKKIGNGKKHLFTSVWVKETKLLKKMLHEEDVSVYCLDKEYHSHIMSKIPRKITLYGHKTTPELLEKIENDEWYANFRTDLLSLFEKERITHAWFEYYILSFNTILQFQKKNIVMTTFFADDPEDTNIITKNYGPRYDKVITFGVQFNDKITIEQKMRDLGCKNVAFLPIIIEPEHYDLKKITFKNRKIDIVYVGALAWIKWIRIHKIYAVFKDRFVIYSKYDPREMKGIIGISYRALNFFYPLPKTQFLNDSEVLKIYKNAKIGFNCHTSFGPANSRLYELCLNGVFQVTDNPKGTKKLFAVGKELVCFETMDEAVELIKKYLDDNTARERIALNGYKRAVKDYSYEANFRRYIKFMFDNKRFS